MQPELVRSCNTHSDPAPLDGRPPQRGRPSPNARSALGGADAAEELIDLPAQRFNLARELMGRYTGAFQPVFSNDLDNLKWPKIKEWDAIYLNDTVSRLS